MATKKTADTQKAHPNKWVLTQDIIDQVKTLAKQGVTEANIARIVGLHPSTFSEKKREYPELADAIKEANAYGEQIVSGHLWNIINDPDHKQRMTAIIFYLKTKHKWADTAAVETKQLPSGVQFTKVSKPTALSDDNND